MPDGSSTRRVGPPGGHHRAGGQIDRAAPWNPLPLDSWRTPDGDADDRRSTPQHLAAAGHPARIGRTLDRRRTTSGRVGNWVLLGGLVGAALIGAASVAIMSAASSGSSPAPGGPPVPTASVDTPTDGSEAGQVDPSAPVQIPTPAVAGRIDPNSSQVPSSAPSSSEVVEAPATVSVLLPGDPGFGWPSSAFGSPSDPNP